MSEIPCRFQKKLPDIVLLVLLGNHHFSWHKYNPQPRFYLHFTRFVYHTRTSFVPSYSRFAWVSSWKPIKKLVPFENFFQAERKRSGRGGVILKKGIEGHDGNNRLDQFWLSKYNAFRFMLHVMTIFVKKVQSYRHHSSDLSRRVLRHGLCSKTWFGTTNWHGIHGRTYNLHICHWRLTHWTFTTHTHTHMRRSGPLEVAGPTVENTRTMKAPLIALMMGNLTSLIPVSLLTHHCPMPTSLFQYHCVRLDKPESSHSWAQVVCASLASSIQ